MSIPLRRGVHRPLEDAADALIKESLAGVTKHSDKADILTPWKEAERRRREVMVPSGVPDAANRQGIFHRVINTGAPHLNSREGTATRGHRVTGAPAIDTAHNGAQESSVVSWDGE